MMKVTAQSKGAKELEVIIEGEDHSLAEIVRKEVVEVPGVVFAGVASVHPLLKRDRVRVASSEKKPEKLIAESVERASSIVSKIREELEAALSQ